MSEQHEAEVFRLDAFKHKMLTALSAAYENANKGPLLTSDLVLGHRSGVRDVAVRLGLYAEFVEMLESTKEDRG